MPRDAGSRPGPVVTSSPPKHNALVYFIGRLSAGFGEPFSYKGETARMFIDQGELYQHPTARLLDNVSMPYRSGDA